MLSVKVSFIMHRSSVQVTLHAPPLYIFLIANNNLAGNRALLGSTIAANTSVGFGLAAVVMEIDVVGSVVKVAVFHVEVGVNAGSKPVSSKSSSALGSTGKLCAINLPHGVGQLGGVAMIIHDVSTLVGELLLAAVGVCDFGETGQGVVSTNNGVLQAANGTLAFT